MVLKKISASNSQECGEDLENIGSFLSKVTPLDRFSDTTIEWKGTIHITNTQQTLLNENTYGMALKITEFKVGAAGSYTVSGTITYTAGYGNVLVKTSFSGNCQPSKSLLGIHEVKSERKSSVTGEKQDLEVYPATYELTLAEDGKSLTGLFIPPQGKYSVNARISLSAN